MLNLWEIQEGTRLTIIFEGEKKYQAEYLGNVDHVNFNILSSEIANDIEQYKNATATVFFFGVDDNYTFTSQIVRVIPGKNDAISCKVISFFTKVPRRADTRVNINLKVKIYPNDKSDGSTYYEAMSSDISKGGIRLWSDHNLNAPMDSRFSLEVTGPLGSSYVFPAKLIRTQKNHATLSYEYDYGFTFSSEINERYERLILDIIGYEMHSGHMK